MSLFFFDGNDLFNTRRHPAPVTPPEKLYSRFTQVEEAKEPRRASGQEVDIAFRVLEVGMCVHLPPAAPPAGFRTGVGVVFWFWTVRFLGCWKALLPAIFPAGLVLLARR